MKTLNINIDGKEIKALPGQTILEAASENGIFIPTLCYDERTEIYGSCGMCVVEVEGNPKLVKACATVIAPNMIVKTDTTRVIESRKTMLELLLSNHAGDCRPPCVVACPAHTDCQGYVGLVANGEYEAALELIKESIPIPASIGRICPRPCEDECRRALVDEPLGIAHIKRFAGDIDLGEGDPWIPECEEDTGRSVGVIGSGPYGLSLAYFLRRRGHAVTLYEAMPKAGGMLRYGIPEYRLPKAVLDDEIAVIEAMGVEILTNTRIGVDVTFEGVRAAHDAMAIGIGAWTSTGTGAPGEKLPGVVGGIDLLQKVIRGEEVALGSRVAVVGGGNTAMDACRTAVRMGAKEVYNIYRRTKNEMPAESIEIEEAEEEGVIFKNLTNPIEYIAGKDGRVAKVKLQIMELGAPDASGRRAPVPVKGMTETIAVDTVVLATGQAVVPLALGKQKLELTRRKGIVYDNHTYMTSMEGVFAGGDCGNDRITIAVEAIGDAKKSSGVIDAYLKGESVEYHPDYIVERTDLTEESFEDRERQFRAKEETLSPEERKDSFSEISARYTDEDAEKEGSRCLECGCGDYFECKLFEYANMYDVKPERYFGDYSSAGEDGKPALPDATDDGHPFIIREDGKCILCGLCVRACDEVMGIAAIGLVDRGFDAVVKAALKHPLTESTCISCGQCVSVCPTGALRERLSLQKSVPLKTVKTETTCSHCSIGCTLELETYEDLLVKADPAKKGAVNRGLVCGRGKFGFDCAELEDRLVEPLVKNTKSGTLEPDSWYNAFIATAKRPLSVAAANKGAVAVSISDRYTNEEMFAIRTLAEKLGAQVFSFNNRASAVEKAFGEAKSPNTLDELLGADYVLVCGFDVGATPIANLKLKQAFDAGAKIVSIEAPEKDMETSPNAKAGVGAYAWATERVASANSLKLLTEVAAAVLEAAPESAKNLRGYRAFASSLKGVKPSAKAKQIAEGYMAANKAIIVYQQNVITEAAAKLLFEIAAVSGHFGSPRDGVVRIAPKNNSQGLYDLGVLDTAADMLAAVPPVKTLIVFGEDPLGQAEAAKAAGAPLPEELKAAEALLKQVEFMVVSDTHLTATAAKADAVLPAAGFAAATGTFTNTEGRLQAVNAAALPGSEYLNWEIAMEIANLCEAGIDWIDEADISRDLDAAEILYREAAVGEVLKSKSSSVTLSEVPSGGKLVSILPASDNLMRMIDERLPV